MATQAVLYTRVSTAGQAAEGVSLEAQSARIIAHCLVNNLEVIGSFCDAGISGKSTKNRPEFNKALELACSKKAVLVFYSLSRVSRSTRDLLDISEKVKKAGAGLVSIQDQIDTSTAMGTFLFTLLAALCALERELIGERTKGALAHLKATGRKTGGHVPYGYNWDGDGALMKSDSEQAVIAVMMDLHGRSETPSAIARHLNTAGITSKLGGKWSGKVVNGILKNWKEGDSA